MRILATGFEFPEGPVCLPDGSLVVVELAASRLNRVWPDGRREILVQTPGSLNGAARGPDGRIYLCNSGGFKFLREHGTIRTIGQADDYCGGSIQVFDLGTGRLDTLYTHCDGRRLIGPNDLVFDETGGFWFTDLGKRRPRELDRSFVYYARPDGSEIREVIGPMLTTNGCGLSPDGKTLYVAETETARLWAFDILAPGQVRQRPWPSPAGGTLVCGVGGYNRFDSLAVTASGHICVAGLHAGGIFEISPDGRSVQLHPVPDLAVTNLCFGGPDLRTAFVTMSHEGRIGVMDWHEPGLKLHFSGL